MTKRAEAQSAKVSPAQQAEAVHPAVWRCAKQCVWTVHMLTALVEGVKGSKWRGQGVGLPPLAQRLLRRTRAVQSGCRPCLGLSIISEVNHQLERRVRENRTSGSQGVTEPNRQSLPLSRNLGFGKTLLPATSQICRTKRTSAAKLADKGTLII